MDAKQLLARGHLPEALPLAFTGANFADVSDTLQHADSSQLKRKWMQTGTVNVARPGGLRRRMSLVNPFKQRLLSLECANEWTALNAHLGKSPISLTKPTPAPLANPNQRGVRYLQYELPRGDRAASRSALLGGTRYTLQTDISNFYGSVYTHAIDWALSTKAIAKSSATGAASSLGARLDKLLRNGQEGQTMGIPVGPDTSHLLAEILLCELDSMLVTEIPSVASRGLRFVDDFEFGARTYSEAESVLRVWESILASFELSLNPAKTAIIEGVLPPEPMWKIQLRQHPVRETREAALANDLRSIFSIAFDASRERVGTPSLSYAMRRLRDIPTKGRAWDELQNLLLGAITVEPSSLKHAYELLARAVWRGQIPDLDRVAETLSELVTHHAVLEHGSEVTWALYLLRRLSARLTQDAAKAVLSMRDNGSLILLRDLEESGRVAGPSLIWDDVLVRAEDPAAGNSADWLLAYEFARQGWSGDSGLRADPHWNELLDRNVSFYESPKPLQANTSLPPAPRLPPVTPDSTVGKSDIPVPATEPATTPSDPATGSTNGGYEGSVGEPPFTPDTTEEEVDLDEVELLSFLEVNRY